MPASDVPHLTKPFLHYAFRHWRLIGHLYRYEREWKARGQCGPALRPSLRSSDFGLTLSPLNRTAEALAKRTLPNSLLGKACFYLLNQWEALVAHCRLGHTEIDNNLVENAIRPSAVGKKNWLFIGHPDAGDRSPSFIQSSPPAEGMELSLMPTCDPAASLLIASLAFLMVSTPTSSPSPTALSKSPIMDIRLHAFIAPSMRSMKIVGFSPSPGRGFHPVFLSLFGCFSSFLLKWGIYFTQPGRRKWPIARHIGRAGTAISRSRLSRVDTPFF